MLRYDPRLHRRDAEIMDKLDFRMPFPYIRSN